MADLQIPEDFCHNDVEPKGKTSHGDGENFHYIWGDGRTDGAASVSYTHLTLPTILRV